MRQFNAIKHISSLQHLWYSEFQETIKIHGTQRDGGCIRTCPLLRISLFHHHMVCVPQQSGVSHLTSFEICIPALTHTISALNYC